MDAYWEWVEVEVKGLHKRRRVVIRYNCRIELCQEFECLRIEGQNYVPGDDGEEQGEGGGCLRPINATLCFVVLKEIVARD